MKRRYEVQVQDRFDAHPDERTWHDVGPEFAWHYQAMMFGAQWVTMPEIHRVRVIRVMSEDSAVR